MLIVRMMDTSELVRLHHAGIHRRRIVAFLHLSVDSTGEPTEVRSRNVE